MSHTINTDDLARRVDDAARAPFSLTSGHRSSSSAAKELEVGRNECALSE